jgi:hypothetical protein
MMTLKNSEHRKRVKTTKFAQEALNEGVKRAEEIRIEDSNKIIQHLQVIQIWIFFKGFKTVRKFLYNFLLSFVSGIDDWRVVGGGEAAGGDGGALGGHRARSRRNWGRGKSRTGSRRRSKCWKIVKFLTKSLIS